MFVSWLKQISLFHIEDFIYLNKQATVLNCMHTFCQFCVNQWKKNKVECPICRAPITTEGKNILVDNMIDAMVCSLSEELKNRRKELVKQRQELYIQPIEQKSDGMNATRGLNMAPVVDRSINGRGRPRRTIATPGRSGTLYTYSINNVIINKLKKMHCVIMCWFACRCTCATSRTTSYANECPPG